jgi:hypothetical protein
VERSLNFVTIGYEWIYGDLKLTSFSYIEKGVKGSDGGRSPPGDLRGLRPFLKIDLIILLFNLTTYTRTMETTTSRTPQKVLSKSHMIIISWDIGLIQDEQLIESFKRVGPIHSIFHTSNRNTLCIFYEKAIHAKEAVDRFNGYHFDDQILHVI